MNKQLSFQNFGIVVSLSQLRALLVPKMLALTYLRLVVVVECGQPPPRRASTGQLDHAGCKHETEEKPANQPECDSVVVAVDGVTPLEELEGCDEDGEKTCLKEENVPLEPQECLPNLDHTNTKTKQTNKENMMG